jgi:alpha-L-fucosidase 2
MSVNNVETPSIIWNTPAKGWRDALPCGNGRVGALVYGRVARERIRWNHESFWSDGHYPSLPDTAADLPKLRALLESGKFREANDFFPGLWRQAGFMASAAYYLPGPELILRHRSEVAYSDYCSTLDLARGQVVTSWNEGDWNFKRTVLVSLTEGIGMVKVETNSPKGLDLQVSLQAPGMGDAIVYDKSGEADNDIRQLKVSESRATAEGLLLSLCGGELGTLHTELRVVRGDIASADEQVLRVTGVSEVVFYLKLVCEDSQFGTECLDWPSANLSPDEVQQQHAAAFRAEWDKIGFQLGPDSAAVISAEDMRLGFARDHYPPQAFASLFHFGRYLMICSGMGLAQLPANLQGIWNGDMPPAWTSGFFLNENLQMNYWASLPLNQSAALLRVFDMLEAHMQDYRDNARQLYGCRGILLPLFMSPRSGRKHNPQAHVVYWSAAAGWIASHYWNYYAYTGDREFLRQRALPFMREAALFYLDFFQLGEDGFWHSSPSQSPENAPLGEFEGAGECHICVDSAMDFAVARELFANLKTAYEDLGCTDEFSDEWAGFSQSLPPYRINADGAVAEWLDPRLQDNYNHRHLSHLYGLFPGTGINRIASPELFEAARIAADKRLEIGMADQTGWSLAHLACIYARLNEGNTALQCLHHLARSCLGVNCFTYHNSDLDMGVTQPLILDLPSPFQIDANFGLLAAVVEMLVRPLDGGVELLPALPEGWPEGQICGICLPGGLILDLHWREGGSAVSVALTSQNALSIEVVFNQRGSRKTCSVNLAAGVTEKIVF